MELFAAVLIAVCLTLRYLFPGRSTGVFRFLVGCGLFYFWARIQL